MTFKKSFTLVEILIITAILVIFSGTLLASYSNFNQRKKLDREVNQLVDVLSLVKGKAQSADVDFPCSGSDEFGGYAVDITAADYSFKQCCRDITTKNPTVCGSVIQTYVFSGTINSTSGPLSISFFPLAEGVTQTNVTLRSSTLNKCSDISISETGIITTTDPIGC